MGERVAVVGGAGFIGTRLVTRLRAGGRDVRVVDKVESPAFPELSACADVRDPGALRRACEGADVLYNLAAEHRDDVRPLSLYDEVNVEGARNVCRVAAELGVRRQVFTSSVAVYGFSDRETDEEADTRPFNDYGRTKLEAEKVYQAWLEATPGASLTVVRPTVVFGEGNRGNVYNLLRQIAVGPFFMVGDGRNVKSMAYVENVAAFLEFALGLGEGGRVYNYVDKPDFDMNGLVACIRRALGRSPDVGLRVPYPVAYAGAAVFDAAAFLLRRPLPVSRIRIEKFCSGSLFSSDRMRRDGFTPPIALADALERTILHEFGAKS